MRTEYIFHTLLIALDVCASVPYAVRGNLRMMIYWLAAATKNTDARLTRVEAPVARFRCWAADCAAHALRTRQRAVLARLARFLRGRKGNDMTENERIGRRFGRLVVERLKRGWSIERALGVCDG